MIKKCPIILANSAVTVVRYDNILVQLPSIDGSAEYLWVNRNNGKYLITSEPTIDTRSNEQKKHKTAKKTTEEMPKVESDEGR